MKINAASIRKGIFAIIIAAFVTNILLVNVDAKSFKDIETISYSSKDTRSLLDEVDVVSDKVYFRQRSSHIDFGMVELTKLSPTRAAIGASTQALHVCPQVHLNIYVDKYDEKNEEWVQWRYWEYSAENVDHLTRNLEIIVPSGNYFSVRGYHICVHGDTIETIDTETDGLYIGITDKPIIN